MLASSMSVRLTEAAISAGFGAADAAVSARGGLGPGKMPWALYLEGAGAAAGLWGGMLKLSGEVRDTLLISSLTLLGRRATIYGMKGALTKPALWGGIGGDGTFADTSGYDAGVAVASGGGPNARLMQARGGYPLYPASQESAGIAG
jgi:hypothetical protein